MEWVKWNNGPWFWLIFLLEDSQYVGQAADHSWESLILTMPMV